MNIFTVTSGERKARIYTDGTCQVLQDVDAAVYLVSDLPVNLLRQLWIGTGEASTTRRDSRLCFQDLETAFQPVTDAELVICTRNRGPLPTKWRVKPIVFDSELNCMYWKTYKLIKRVVEDMGGAVFQASIRLGGFDFVVLTSSGLNNLRLALRLARSASCQ